MKIALLFLVLVIQYHSMIFGARILAIEPYGIKSHWQYMKSILDLLSIRHQVTVITPLPSGDRENYTEIDASRVFPIYLEKSRDDMIKRFGSVLKIPPSISEQSHELDICDAFFDFEPVKKLMSPIAGESPRYDIILLEPFYSPCLSYLAHQLRVPEIYTIPSSMITSMEMLIFGTEPNPSYVPNLLYNGATIENFMQRLNNVALFTYIKIVQWITNLRMMYHHEPKHYNLTDVRHKPSLVFINTHFITESPRPVPVNMIQIGGIHLKPQETLPNDINEFIENWPHGVIYFTFGSMSSMSTLPKNIKEIFIETFAQLPQRVLWKCEANIKNLPDNIMIKKWFPQRDILLHPNVKLLISGGEISEVYEAVDAEIPVLGIPLFYDQPRNVGNLIDAGMALSLDISTITKNKLYQIINELMNNEKYLRNAKIVSKLFKDQPMSHSKMINYWFEYVLRHNGAYHLKSKALKLTWYEYKLLDIIVAFITLLFIIMYLTYIFFNWLQNYAFKLYKLFKRYI